MILFQGMARSILPEAARLLAPTRPNACRCSACCQRRARCGSARVGSRAAGGGAQGARELAARPDLAADLPADPAAMLSVIGAWPSPVARAPACTLSGRRGGACVWPSSPPSSSSDLRAGGRGPGRSHRVRARCRGRHLDRSAGGVVAAARGDARIRPDTRRTPGLAAQETADSEAPGRTAASLRSDSHVSCMPRGYALNRHEGHNDVRAHVLRHQRPAADSRSGRFPPGTSLNLIVAPSSARRAPRAFTRMFLQLRRYLDGQGSKTTIVTPFSWGRAVHRPRLRPPPRPGAVQPGRQRCLVPAWT